MMLYKFIPNVVGALAFGMKSASSEVRETAKETMEMVKNSINNEAVAELFPYLMNAIVDSTKIGKAIDMITHLNLKQRIDMISLSLIIPVVVHGSDSNDMKIKTNSLKVIGHLPDISLDDALATFSDVLRTNLELETVFSSANK